MQNIKKMFIDNQVHEFKKNEPSDIGMINKHHIVLDMIKKYSNANDRILDIGCSDGKILKSLMADGYTKLFGIDIQEDAMHAFDDTKIHFANCDFENEKIPFAGKFDLIIISDVLEHTFSPQTVLYDLRQKLAPLGKIVFSMPNAGWFANGILLTFFPSKLFVSTAFGPWGHTHQFTFFEVNKIAHVLKYKILELKGGKLDNYAFKVGVKKILFDLFVIITSPLASKWSTLFSAHIFGVIEMTSKSPTQKDRFDSGV